MAVMRCIEPFVFWTDGVPRAIRTGDLVDDDDAAYVKHRAHFEGVKASNVPAVERATAAPGERRRLTTERKANRSPK